jgi:hypothetical protein
VTFPQTPMIIAMNLNTTDGRRNSFGNGDGYKCDEIFVIILFTSARKDEEI